MKYRVSVFFVCFVLVFAACAKIQPASDLLGEKIASGIDKRISMNFMGFEPGGNRSVIKNESSFFAQTWIYNRELPRLAPGDGMFDTSFWEPFRYSIPVPILAVMWRTFDEKEKLYTGFLGVCPIITYRAPWRPFQEVITNDCIETPEGGWLSEDEVPPQRESAARFFPANFPRVAWDGTLFLQAFNPEPRHKRILIAENRQIILPPFQVVGIRYVDHRRTTNVLIQRFDGGEVPAGFWERSFSAAPWHGIIVAQLVPRRTQFRR